MRALFNLIFFLLVLLLGFFGGYLYSRTGQPVPVVQQYLDDIVPARSSQVDQAATQRLQTQDQAIKQLTSGLQNAEQQLARMDQERRALEQALTQARRAGGGNGGGGTDPSVLAEFADENQFMASELTRMTIERDQVATQLATLQQQANNGGAANAQAAAAIAQKDQQLAALKAEADQAKAALGQVQQQVATLQQAASTQPAQPSTEATQQLQALTAERQQLASRLNQAISERDGVVSQFRNLQNEYKTVVDRLNTSGVNVQQILQNPQAQEAVRNVLQSLTGGN